MPRTRDRASARPGHPDRSTSCSGDRPSRIRPASLPNSQRWSMLRALPLWGRLAAYAIDSIFESCDRWLGLGRARALPPRWSRRRLKTRRSPIPVRQRLRFAAVFPRLAGSGKRWTGHSFVPADLRPVPKVVWRRTAQPGAVRKVSVAQSRWLLMPGSPRCPLMSERSSSSKFPSI